VHCKVRAAGLPGVWAKMNLVAGVDFAPSCWYSHPTFIGTPGQYVLVDVQWQFFCFQLSSRMWVSSGLGRVHVVEGPWAKAQGLTALLPFGHHGPVFPDQTVPVLGTP